MDGWTDERMNRTQQQINVLEGRDDFSSGAYCVFSDDQ